VSAARGEVFGEGPDPLPPEVRGCAYFKWGLAGARGLDWCLTLGELARRVAEQSPEGQLVTVAYADWELAGAPPVEEVCAFARQRPGSAFLLDTWTKAPCPATRARPTLLDYLSLPEVARLCRLCREAGVRVALAGSLGREQIERLLGVAPDWFAVRGAVCAAGERTARVDVDKVRALAKLAGGGVTPLDS
jgi:uncharacterized protein (UPF0264 family)